jgi:hypothetical protein
MKSHTDTNLKDHGDGHGGKHSNQAAAQQQEFDDPLLEVARKLVF